jgi:transposase
MVFYGYYVLKLLIGMICPIGTPHRTKYAIIEDFCNGYVLVYLRRFFMHYQLIYVSEGSWISNVIDGTFIVAKKRGWNEVGRATKGRGKGTKKLMAIISDNADGLPISVYVTSTASPHHEVTTLAEVTISAKCFVSNEKPEHLIGDKAYDSDPLDARLAIEYAVELIAPNRYNRQAPSTQHGRSLCSYKHRWKIERLFAWLHNFHRILVRYEYHAENYLGFVQLGCMMILLRRCL